MADEFEKYVQMCSAGVEAISTYKVARSGGLDQIASIRMLRVVYGLSLEEAGKISFERDSGESHDEQEGNLVSDFTKVLDDELGID